MSTKAGHHGDVLYKFEDAGFDTSPSDTTFKIFGSNATLDTYEGSHEAVRVFNADRKAAQIIRQVFDGAWSITGELSEPPWWLSGVWGQPTTTGMDTDGDGVNDLWEHKYSLGDGNDPETLRLYTPTDGFSEVETLSGCAVASFSVDQTQPNNPEFTITGAYAREPFRQAISPTIPALSESTFSNRKAELTVGGSTVGRAQNAGLDVQTGTELVGEIGSGQAVDFTPKTFAPDPTWDKILFEGQTVDALQRFLDATSTALSLVYDNGETGSNQYIVDFDVIDSFPNQWSESGRNDPEADLMDELQEMGEDATCTVTVDQSAPPT